MGQEGAQRGYPHWRAAMIAGRGAAEAPTCGGFVNDIAASGFSAGWQRGRGRRFGGAAGLGRDGAGVHRQPGLAGQPLGDGRGPAEVGAVQRDMPGMRVVMQQPGQEIDVGVGRRPAAPPAARPGCRVASGPPAGRPSRRGRGGMAPRPRAAGLPGPRASRRWACGQSCWAQALAVDERPAATGSDFRARPQRSSRREMARASSVTPKRWRASVWTAAADHRPAGKPGSFGHGPQGDASRRLGFLRQASSTRPSPRGRPRAPTSMAAQPPASKAW